ncbi:MAG: NADPH:quinone oxidoreductase family protein [Ilumatobacteraceae bacterium]
MRVVACHSFAAPEHLVIEERPSPPCGPGQVRIEVTAVGVNFVDGLIVQGLYQIKPPLPFVAGSEVAGRLTEVGADVPASLGLSVGQRVVASVGFGGFATEIVAPPQQVTPVPGSISDGQAATFLQSYATAWFALHYRARAQAGQRLLVLGAGGGVGLAAVDVGRAMGLRVIAAASSADKRELAVSRGAEATVDSSVDDVATVLKEQVRQWGGGGVDLVYDPVGGELTEHALRSLVEDGQLLVVGFASGTIPRLPANHVLLRNRRVTGVEWGGWVATHPAENRALVAEVFAMVAAGDVQPVEPRAYRFDDAAVALRDQLERRVAGKSVLIP